MNSKISRLIAKRLMPIVIPKIFHDCKRHEIIGQLESNRIRAIELGVAEGSYSKRLLESGRIDFLFGVDMYGDIHDTNEYVETLKYLGLESRHKLLRMDFSSAAKLFPDHYFDFIYIDGFAHTGQEGGKTLAEWWPKLRHGGVFAGDDYHHDWPLVVWAINHFVHTAGEQLNVTGATESIRFSEYPSWFLIKTKDFVPVLDSRLLKIAQIEKTRIAMLRRAGQIRNMASKRLRILLSNSKK